MIDRNDKPRDDESRGSFVGKNRACHVGEFFKGWRRKAGLVTLGIAVAGMVVWMRSLAVNDVVLWRANGIASGVSSVAGGVSWTTYTSPAHSSEDYWWGSTAIETRPSHGWWQAKNECDTIWEWQSLGFCFGAALHPFYGTPERAAYWLVPYWSLVLPLTLLSAWLILVKPRKVKAANGGTS